MKTGRLQGKVAIVTGLGSGIGQGCALMFAREGAKVVSCDINPETTEAALAKAREEGLQIDSLHPCDLTRQEDVQKLIDLAVQRHGGIDILVNAAAWTAFASIEEMDFESQWKNTIAGELDVVFLACKAAWPYLKRSGRGSIINFSSVNSYEGIAGGGALAHCAGKGGVLALTRQLAVEGGPHGIRANTIMPGLIVTGNTRPRLENEPGFRQTVEAKQMLGRLGQPEDVAYCATFLAADESAFVTASDYRVDGGVTAW
ncbi:TPA: SDR family oxidoreductase [Klebsiella pneumoniae]|nr:SDR family oxidoreductase [Klebsiella pneumoniae]